MSCLACTPGCTGGTSGLRCENGYSFLGSYAGWFPRLWAFWRCFGEQAGGAFKDLIIYIYACALETG